MLIGASTVKNTQSKQDFYNQLEDSQIAYLAGQSAAELGVLAMKDHYAGYDATSALKIFRNDSDGDGLYETYGNYQVYGKAQENGEYGDAYTYYTPIPGTGTAGDPDDCSILDNEKPLNDPCNWNRLLYGQSVTIPLYSDDDDGNRLSPSALGLTGWTLKVRTPCIDEEEDPERCARYILNEGTGSLEDDNSVILWQILGETNDAIPSPIVVMPNDQPAICVFLPCRDPYLNTEIYESLINAVSDYISDTYVVIDSTKAISNNFGIADLYGESPVASYLSMRLNIVTELLEYGTEASIPYLEWQLVTESDEPVGDTKSIIIGKGYYEGSKDTYYYPFVVTRSTTGESTNVYTLSN